MNNRKVFWTLINILIVVLIVVAFSASTLMLRTANSTIATRTINIQGTGEVTATPDTAQFSFSAIAQASSAEEAEQEATKNLNQAIKFLKDSDVDEKDIKTTSFNIYPQYNYNRKPLIGDYEGPEIVGYQANQSVTVKIKDLDNAGEIVGGVARNGASQVSGLSFTIDDLESYRAQARQEAFDNAWNKANEMAKQAGVRIARVVSFSEGGSYGGGIYAARGLAFDEASVESAPVIPEIEPGQQDLSVTVNVTYEIK